MDQSEVFGDPGNAADTAGHPLDLTGVFADVHLYCEELADFPGRLADLSLREPAKRCRA